MKYLIGFSQSTICWMVSTYNFLWMELFICFIPRSWVNLNTPLYISWKWLDKSSPICFRYTTDHECYDSCLLWYFGCFEHREIVLWSSESLDSRQAHSEVLKYTKEWLFVKKMIENSYSDMSFRDDFELHYKWIFVLICSMEDFM